MCDGCSAHSDCEHHVLGGSFAWTVNAAHVSRQHSEMNISSNKSSAYCSNWGTKWQSSRPWGWIEICQLRCALRQQLQLGKTSNTTGARSEMQQPSLSVHINWQQPMFSLNSEASQVGMAPWFVTVLVYNCLSNGDE